jgi:hypothetical protein
VRHHTVDQAHRQRLVRPHRTAREDQVQRSTEADQPGQAHRATVDQRHAPAPAEDPEHGVLLHHPQIAPQRQLEAAGDGITGDGRDHRLAKQHTSRPHRSVSGRLQRIGLAGGHGFEIEASAEVAVIAGEDTHQGVRVGIEGREGARQLARRAPIHGVADLGPAEQHGGNGAVALDVQCHVYTSRRISRKSRSPWMLRTRTVRARQNPARS